MSKRVSLYPNGVGVEVLAQERFQKIDIAKIVALSRVYGMKGSPKLHTIKAGTFVSAFGFLFDPVILAVLCKQQVYHTAIAFNSRRLAVRL